MENERIYNSSKDALIIVRGYRTIIPDESRAVLKPLEKRQARGCERNNVVTIAR